MIRKLKAKFIITNMLLISVVLVAAFVFVYFSTAANLKSQSSAAMKHISASSSISNIPFFSDRIFDHNKQYSYLTTFTIETDEINMTYSINGYDVRPTDFDEEQSRYINELIDFVYSTSSNEGVFEKYNLRYYSSDILFGKRIVFLDKEYEDSTLNQLTVNFAVVGAGALTAFFIISVIISRLAVKPVEKSLEQQKQLVADASHELKTPLTVISTNTDILLTNKNSTIEEQSKWVNYIKTESERMTSLINNMLFLAKTDESKKMQTQCIINLSDIVNECILPFESIAYEKNKNFDITIMPDIYIKGNQNSIKQLLIILVDNAFKYSDQNGRIKITVSEVHDKAIINVWNSGIPIPPNHLSHIFERFYRVDKSRSRSEGGYGLGLSIAKSVIDSHNAKITVTSTPENGTNFRCVFKKQ